MSITAANVYTVVNARTGRTGDHEEELLAVLQDLAICGVNLWSETEQALTSGDRSYTVPSNTKRVRAITLEDASGNELGTLDEITYEDYKNRLQPSASNGRPAVYAVFNGVIYLDPPPLATSYANINIIAELYHAVLVSTISWPDRFKECIVEGVCWKTLLGLDLGGSLGVVHGKSYEDEKMKLLAAQGNEKLRRTQNNEV